MKTLFAGLAALCIAIPSASHAQAPAGQAQAGHGQLLADAVSKDLIERRLDIIKAALSLTPEQQKLWPAVEDAIRGRLTARHQRLVALAARLEAAGSGEFDPIAAVNARADALAQRAAALKKLADAWKPLYASLDDNQKRRLRFLTLYVLREMRDAAESRRIDAEEHGDDDDDF